MSRIRLNRPEYGLAHLTAETEENKNISIPLIYKQDITGTFLPAFLDYKKAKPGKGQILLSIYEEDGLGWLIAVDRDIVYFLNKDTKEVYTVARGGSYFIRKCMNCFLEYPDDWAKFDVEDTPGIYDYPTAVQERTAYIEAMSDELAMYMLRSKT